MSSLNYNFRVVVRENAVLSKKLLKIDPKARVSLTKAMSLKDQFQQYQCLSRTYQDLRLPKTETVVDGTIQVSFLTLSELIMIENLAVVKRKQRKTKNHPRLGK